MSADMSRQTINAGTRMAKGTDAGLGNADKKIRIGGLEGKYRIVAEVSRGGYGVVYMAERINGRGKVAIKVYYPSGGVYYAMQELLYMDYLGESEGFLKALEAGITNSVAWVVMEWAEGIRFEEVQTKGYYGDYLACLCKCLHRLHSLGLVHHDLKPGNFLYSRDPPKATLIDYGTLLIVSFT